jgi:hypothetical protein
MDMKITARAVFFWILVLLFLVAAPIMVLRARGYRFDARRGVFVHSGTITVKSNPPEISIALNGKLQEGQTNRINNSVNVTGLIPQNYDIEVGAPGFQAWKKKVDVHSGIASEFWNVLLVRENYERANYGAAGIDKFFISPKNDLAAWTENSQSGFSVKILDIDNKENTSEFIFANSIFSGSEIEENIEWSPQQDFLSVPAKITTPPVKPSEKTEEKLAYFIADLSQKSFFNFSEFIKLSDLRGLRWDPQEKYFLFFSSGDSLFRADIRDKNSLTLIANDVSSFELSRSHIYYTQKPNEIVYRSSFDGQGEKIQITDNFPEASPLPTDKLIIYDESRIAFLDQGHRLFIRNSAGARQEYFRQIGEAVQGMQFSDDGKKLLYWTGNELFVYFLRGWEVQPARGENEIQNITRYAESVGNVQWFKDYEHIIFTVGNRVKIIELDSRDQRICQEIAELSLTKAPVVYNNSLEQLFFAGKNGDSSDLFSIVFPEKTGLLGLGL